MTSQTDEKLSLIIEGIRERKGRDITIIDMSELDTAPAPRMVVCQGTSTMHVAGVADSVRDYLLEHARIKPYNYDGYRESRWIVIDYGDTLVHVFMPDERKHYDLEELWSDAHQTTLPDQY